MNIFEEGSAFQRFLGKMTDLMILNIVTLLMCLPVITAGAALTGMHYVLLKMVREQEGYIVPSFFRSFKRNLLQATLLWGVFLVLWYLISINLILLVRGGSGGSLWLLCALSVTAFILVVVMIYTFAILSRFGCSSRWSLWRPAFASRSFFRFWSCSACPSPDMPVPESTNRFLPK